MCGFDETTSYGRKFCLSKSLVKITHRWRYTFEAEEKCQELKLLQTIILYNQLQYFHKWALHRSNHIKQYSVSVYTLKYGSTCTKNDTQRLFLSFLYFLHVWGCSAIYVNFQNYFFFNIAKKTFNHENHFRPNLNLLANYFIFYWS